MGNKPVEEIQKMAEPMKENIKNTWGIEIGFVRYRTNEVDLEPYDYRIVIKDIPIATGSIKQNARLFSGFRTDKCFQISISPFQYFSVSIDMPHVFILDIYQYRNMVHKSLESFCNFSQLIISFLVFS